MRTSHSVPALVAAVGLLAAASVAAVAQDDGGSVDPAAGLPVVVTGGSTCTVIERGTSATPNVLIHESNSRIRDQQLECVLTMSDARVSGTGTGTFNDSCFDSASGSSCVFWGSSEIVGPDGRWQCTFTGTGDPYGQNDGLLSSVCRGTEGYEGLTYKSQDAVSFSGAADFGDGTSTYGLIYEGDPPPPEAPAE